MSRTRIVLATAALVVLALAACTAPDPDPSPSGGTGQAAPVPEDAFTPVIARTLSIPRGVPSTDGKVHLAYELYLNNVTSQTATVQRVDVVDQDGGSLLTLDGDEVTTWMRVYGAATPGRVLGPGQGAIVWLDVVVDSMADLPTSLSHSISFGFEPGAPPIIETTMTEQLARTEVSAQPAIVVGPPLEGAGWLNGNSCCQVTPHRAAVNAINGDLHAPERYGIDYVQLDGNGSFLTGPADQLESYTSFGANILAVGDGPIVSMRWDLPEQVPGADPAGLTLDEYGGNHIVQDLGDGVYAFYAHLQPGNAMGVEVGQQLRKGEVIGLLGNTGNSDSPHLHFHLMDSPSPLGSNSLPFVYDSFELAGTITEQDLFANIAAGGPFTIDPADAGPKTDLYPLYLTVMNYPTPR